MAATGRPGPGRAEWAALILLAGASGATDVLAFTALGQVFAGVMTGNLVLLGLALTGTGGDGLAAPLLALAGYAAGAALAAQLVRRGAASGSAAPGRAGHGGHGGKSGKGGGVRVVGGTSGGAGTRGGAEAPGQGQAEPEQPEQPEQPDQPDRPDRIGQRTEPAQPIEPDQRDQPERTGRRSELGKPAEADQPAESADVASTNSPAHAPRWPRPVVRVLAGEAVLLGAVTVGWAFSGGSPAQPWRGVLLVALGLAMGAQSGALAATGAAAGPGTYFTGTLTKLVVRTAGAEGDRSDLGGLARLVALTGGAAAAAGLRSACPAWATVVPLGLAAAAVAAVAPARPRRGPGNVSRPTPPLHDG